MEKEKAVELLAKVIDYYVDSQRIPTDQVVELDEMEIFFRHLV